MIPHLRNLALTAIFGARAIGSFCFGWSQIGQGFSGYGAFFVVVSLAELATLRFFEVHIRWSP